MSAATTLAPPPSAPQLPLRVRRLAYAGLVPFVVGAALVWLVREDVRADAALVLAAYAALIASFLGGIHWGGALRDAELHGAALAWGVVPSLVAWPAVLMPAHAGLVILGLLLAGCYAVDRRLYPALGLAHVLTLRFRLSALAALSCFIGAAGA